MNLEILIQCKEVTLFTSCAWLKKTRLKENNSYNKLLVSNIIVKIILNVFPLYM